jgi:aldose 1-epimerase
MNTNPGTYSYTHPSGKDIYQYELKNKKGTTVGITNWGAIINYFRIKKSNGEINDIVHGFTELKDYLGETYLSQYPWFGCVVGRYANRIANACFELDGKEYHLTKNNGPHQLHGGPGGFDRRAWDFVGQGMNGSSWIEFKYLSVDGEEGFPGNLETFVKYELNENDEFTYTLTAVTDQPTPVNLTQHSYFNLNNNKGTIHNHDLKLYCSNTIDQDETLVATGRISDVDNTPFDFRELRSIGEGLEHIDEYDKSFIRDQKGYGLAAELHCSESGTHLYVYTTEPVVHFYSGKWTPKVEGKDGIIYGPFSALCLETHKPTNAVNIPQFPNTILRPGDQYYQKTMWKVVC